MGYHDHKHNIPDNINCAVIIISDSRTEQTDESGKFIMDAMKQAGHNITSYSLLKNNAESVLGKIDDIICDESTQVIITSGGTGASHLDVTIETITPILDKKMDGFGELFRLLTYQEIGTGSILSRAMAGIIKEKVIISLPGSLGAVKLAMEKIILPEIGHLVSEATR
ncbi:MAG: molybdenum cofactor biosynthesis protein MoaB [Dehalococcoidales bacterium]|jgi:molybdenum cofactor biosynthesis protein B|nr:molybdenum cofactor biosynthesis protein MoaB [Dehalococcoidales bacterium]